MERTIMICDDTLFMRAVIKRTVSAAGYKVVGEAVTGNEAVECYKRLKPDIVTMDVVMPGGSGIDAVETIMADDPTACIVMVSAVGQEELMGRARSAGARGFIVKPFEGDALLKELEHALAGSSAFTAGDS